MPRRPRDRSVLAAGHPRTEGGDYEACTPHGWPLRPLHAVGSSVANRQSSPPRKWPGWMRLLCSHPQPWWGKSPHSLVRIAPSTAVGLERFAPVRSPPLVQRVHRPARERRSYSGLNGLLDGIACSLASGTRLAHVPGDWSARASGPHALVRPTIRSPRLPWIRSRSTMERACAPLRDMVRSPRWDLAGPLGPSGLRPRRRWLHRSGQ